MMYWRRRAAAASVVAVLAVAGCGGGDWARLPVPPAPGTAPPGAVEGTEVTWRPCPEVPEDVLGEIAPAAMVRQLVAGVTYECATLPVPHDWDDPAAGGTFDLALVRARSDDQSDRVGSLLVNPGGPGASGVDLAVYLTVPPEFGGLPEELTGRFDIVGFDPRGVSRSDPVECLTGADLDEAFGAEPDPAGDADFDTAVAASQRMAQACEAKYGDTLRFFSTRQAAHDMDAIRAAAGDDAMTYLGFSYGTLLGAVYAQLFPDRIRAMVLDGAVDPQQDEVAASLGQAEGFERAFDNFADWCDATPGECPLGPDSRATVTDAIEAAGRAPVPGNDGREATAGWVFWSVVATLYVRDWWPDLGAAIDRLDLGDPSGVFELVDRYTGRDASGSYPNLFDALTAVNCVDDDADLTLADVRSLQDKWRAEHPLFGGPLAASLLDCVLWPAGPDPYPTGPADGAPPILVVGTTGDPATPYEATTALAEMLGVGVVLTWDGEGHTAFPGDECIDQAVIAYLVDLTVPDDGTVC